MTQLNDELALSRLFSNLYTELFQRGELGENTTIKKTAHNIEWVWLLEDIHTILHVQATTDYVWGVSGTSPHVTGTKLACDWGIGFWG